MKFQIPKIGILCLVLGILFFAGCLKTPAKTAKVEGARNAQAILVERSIKEAESRIRTIKGFAHVTMIDKDEARDTELALVLSRPNRIRADAIDTLADVWAAAGTDGKRLWLWVPQKQKLYRGAATPRNLRRLAAFDWEIPELLSIIAGLVPDARNAELDEVVEGGEAHYVLRGKPIHIWVDPKTKNPVQLVRYKDDKVQYEVKFESYKKIEDASFPHEIEVSFPEREFTFYLRYRNVEFNSQVDASLFKPEDVWRKQTVEIDK